MQERSNSGRIPAKLKLSCKQGGREQQTRSYTLPFPNTAVGQLTATALGSVNPAVAQSSAVHTLIPNLAPRSRLHQQSLGTSSSSSSGALEGKLGAAESSGQVPGAEDFSKEHSKEYAGELLQSGCHQTARQAIFQAAMSLLKPKLAEPVLVNFMSVAGMFGLYLPLSGCFCMCLCTCGAALLVCAAGTACLALCCCSLHTVQCTSSLAIGHLVLRTAQHSCVAAAVLLYGHHHGCKLGFLSCEETLRELASACDSGCCCMGLT